MNDTTFDLETETICLEGDPGTIAFALPKGWVRAQLYEDSIYSWMFDSPDGRSSVFVGLLDIDVSEPQAAEPLQKFMLACALTVLVRANMKDGHGDHQREPDGYHVWTQASGQDGSGAFVDFAWAKVLDMGDRGVERPEIYFVTDADAVDAQKTKVLKQHFEAELNSIADQLRGKKTLPPGIGPAVPWRKAVLKCADGGTLTCKTPLGWTAQLGTDGIWWFEDKAGRWRHELGAQVIDKVSKRAMEKALEANVKKVAAFARDNLNLVAPPDVIRHKNGRRVEITFEDNPEGRPQTITRWYAFIHDDTYIRLHRQTFACDTTDLGTPDYAALKAFFAEQTDAALSNGIDIREK